MLGRLRFVSGLPLLVVLAGLGLWPDSYVRGRRVALLCQHLCSLHIMLQQHRWFGCDMPCGVLPAVVCCSPSELCISVHFWLVGTMPLSPKSSM
jgi:hypothetical protein